VANNLYTTFRIISIKTSENFMVGKATWPVHLGILWSPCLDHLVICL
jgi:hypothetical protein